MHYRWGYWQMKFAIRFLCAASGAALLVSCGGGKMVNGSVPGTVPVPAVTGVSDFPVKIGTPYSVGDISYTPQDAASYDDVGYASFYGDELSGNRTANGEMFNPAGISAAHKTLPLPSYVEVTALDTGRTILVRINDRGPFANDRLIDLSAGAARQLGITQQGVAGVRVRRVNPPEQERGALRAGRPVAERIETPGSLLGVLNAKLAKLQRPANAASPMMRAALPQTAAAPSPNDRFIREGNIAGTAQPPRAVAARPIAAPRPAGGTAAGSGRGDRFIREGADAAASRSAPQVGGGRYIVQLASYSSKARADQLARALGASVDQSRDGALFRVRLGPYVSEAEAQRGLATAQQRGYSQARIFRE
jgi:rare lipoprotein A